jgi:hypothetical protein
MDGISKKRLLYLDFIQLPPPRQGSPARFARSVTVGLSRTGARHLRKQFRWIALSLAEAEDAGSHFWLSLVQPRVGVIGISLALSGAHRIYPEPGTTITECDYT